MDGNMAYSTSDLVSETISERWGREIELQKAMGMTPSEATIYTARENGLTIEEIAEKEALNVQTVKNVLTKARKKINGDMKMRFYIVKPNQSSDRAVTEQNLIQVLSLMCRNMGLEVKMRPHIITVGAIERSCAGDVNWFKTNVERYVDMIGTRSDTACEERAKRIYDIYKAKMDEQGLTEPKFGHAVVKYYLDKFYLTYDIDECEE